MKVLAVIPARGGSKRLPRKNILDLCGKPLIKWTIDAALDCKEIDTIVVSTDSHEIANIAISCGVEVPFLRREELSTDTASSIDVVLDVIDYYESKNCKYDAVMLLQPTSPLRTAIDIQRAIALFREKNASAVISTTKCEHSPLWCNTLSDDLDMNEFISDDVSSKRSQDLPTYFRLNGAIYLIDTFILKKEMTFIPKNSFSLIMNNENSIDIDTKIDFLMAKAILEYKSNNCCMK